jgi:large subunit ribosomal protein L29
MKIDEARSKTDSELNFELANMKKELFELRFRSSTETTASPARIGELRKSIARVQTIIHERSRRIRGQEPR